MHRSPTTIDYCYDWADGLLDHPLARHRRHHDWKFGTGADPGVRAMSSSGLVTH
jgi:hypothetical protein